MGVYKLGSQVFTSVLNKFVYKFSILH
jgi:hypothetical protein